MLTLKEFLKFIFEEGKIVDDKLHESQPVRGSLGGGVIETLVNIRIHFFTISLWGFSFPKIRKQNYRKIIFLRVISLRIPKKYFFPG